MSSIYTACDPLYSIDYSQILKSSSASSSAIKAFASSIKAMTNNSYTSLIEDSDLGFGTSLSSSMTTSIYKSLYNSSNAYSNSLATSLLSSSNYSLYINEYEDELNEALKKLYTSSNITIKNNNMLNVINESNFVNELENSAGKIYLDKNFSNDNPVLCYEINGEINKININDINLKNATKSEISCLIAYESLNEENKFPESLNNVISFSNDISSNDDDYEKLISFATNYKKYKKVYSEYQNAQEEIDKLNEENEKIEAMFDLIDAINEMYSNYNKKKRENYYD